MPKLRLALLGTLLLASTLHAGLKWEQTQLEFHPEASAPEVKGEFKFTNTGQTAVTITSVTPECGCTTATLEKMIYQAGEQGHIAAVFNIGQRRGDQTKHIRVQIEGDPSPTQLTLLIHIPEVVRLTPDFVYWQAGEAPTPKTITITVIQKRALNITKVTSSYAKIRPELEAIHEGREYRITITPQDTATDAMAVLTLEALVAPGQMKTFQAYAQVKPAVK